MKELPKKDHNSIPERATGRVGFVTQGGRTVVGNLKAWEMTFPAGRKQPDPGTK